MMNEYHDWYILGLLTDVDKDTIDLSLGQNGKRSLLRFSNVRRCIFNNFTIGNIIFDIYFCTGDLGEAQALNSSKDFAELVGTNNDTVFFKELVRRIAEGDLYYVKIIPSYGCFAQIICEDIEELNNQ